MARRSPLAIAMTRASSVFAGAVETGALTTVAERVAAYCMVLIPLFGAAPQRVLHGTCLDTPCFRDFSSQNEMISPKGVLYRGPACPRYNSPEKAVSGLKRGKYGSPQQPAPGWKGHF